MGNWFDERAKSSARRSSNDLRALNVDPVAEVGLSRRDVLKRGGIVAGVAWTAPVLMSVMTPAAAVSPCPPNTQACTTTSGSTICCPIPASGIPPDTCPDGECIPAGELGGFCLNNGMGAGGCNDDDNKCNNPGPGPEGRGICGGPGSFCETDAQCFGDLECTGNGPGNQLLCE